MKVILLMLFFSLFITSCSKAPECHYRGGFLSEANAGCLVINDNKVLFVEGLNGKLSLPGGGLSSGEAPQCTAEREVWEETGIEVIANEKISVFDNGFQLFRCQVTGASVLDGSHRPWRLEIKQIHWLSKDDFADKAWRFPDQINLIQRYLTSATSKQANSDT